MADHTEKKYAYDRSQDSRRNPNTARGDRGAYIMVDTLDPTNSIKLGLTRAIGDYHAHKVGLTHEPHVSITFLDEDLGDQAVLFMASDGILDCYRMEQLAEVVMTTAPDQLMALFVAKGKELFHKTHDDMSFVLKQL
jgi:serine/threonine protein phosphatase PrpC